MAELKTKPTAASVATFIKSIENGSKRKDCNQLLKLMREITGKQAKMRGDSIIGFGKYHYKYKTGREGDFFVTRFSPRKQNLTIYIMPGLSKYQSLLKKLGNHKTSVSCLYLKNLNDIDLGVLKKLIQQSVKDMGKLYKCT